MSLKARMNSIESGVAGRATQAAGFDIEPWLAALSDEDRRRNLRNLVCIFRRIEDPLVTTIEDVWFGVDPSDKAAVACAGAARTILDAWEAGRQVEPPVFGRYVVWHDEFDRVTKSIQRNLARVSGQPGFAKSPSLDEIRDRALDFILLTPHKIAFALEDFGLERHARRVKSMEHTQYDWSPEEYQRILKIRENVARDRKGREEEQPLASEKAGPMARPKSAELGCCASGMTANLG